MGIRSRRNKVGLRMLAFVLAFVVMFTGLPLMNYGKVETKAATTVLKASDVAAFFKSQKSYRGNACLGFCNKHFRDEFGVNTGPMLACCPEFAIRNKKVNLNTNRNNIPIGAYVYFYGSSKQGRCKCGNRYGHVGVYVGDGLFANVNSKGVVNLDTIEKWEGKGWNYPFAGWALNPNVDIIQDGKIIDVPKPSSSIIITGPNYPSGNLDNGERFWLKGIINSTYNLTDITATVYNADGSIAKSNRTGKDITKKVVPNSTSYDLAVKKAIDNAMVFNELNTGSYHFVVSAKDSEGFSKNVIDTWFSVGSIAQPTMGLNPVIGGVNVTLYAPTGGVYYTLDGSNPSSASKRYTGASIPLTSSTTIKAIAIDGNNKSDIVSQYVAVGALSVPTINTYLGSDALTVNVTADPGTYIRYTTDGSEPTINSSQYYGAFQVKDTTVIKAKAFKNGCANSSTATVTATVAQPSTPSISLSGSNKIAVGDAVRVTWDTQATAYSYSVKLYKGSSVIQEQTVQGNACAFTLPEAGEYSITATAKNFKGASSESYPPITVTAMEPLTVTFRDYDETVIATQQVKYGYYAELPLNPSRRGYNFKKWDVNKIYQPITSDVVATAQYDKKIYIVKFVDEDGTTLAPQQEVKFEESVVLPEDPTTDNDGYAFMGWRCISSDESSALNYESVDANMTLQAVFDWGNKDIPVIVKIKEALQVDSNSYKVSLSMKNWPVAKTY